LVCRWCAEFFEAPGFFFGTQINRWASKTRHHPPDNPQSLNVGEVVLVLLLWPQTLRSEFLLLDGERVDLLFLIRELLEVGSRKPFRFLGVLAEFLAMRS